MKNLKIFLTLAVVVIGLFGLSGCFNDPNEDDLCTNTCQYAYDGECDDGGPGSITSLCPCATDCADCGERSELDCGGGSSSSSSGGSSSSSSGGGYTTQEAVGTWFGNSPNGNHWYLYLCGNGLFTFIEYNPVGELQFNHTGTWSISGSTLYLSGSNNWTFQIIDITTAGAGGMTLTSSGSQVLLENQLGQDPCATTGSSSSSSSGGSSSSSSSGGPVSCGTSVTDVDGNTYQVVQIGDQCWMGSNLRTTRYRNGVSIQQGTPCNTLDENLWNNYSGAYWAYPGCDQSNLSRDGLVYTPMAITNSQGICPDGWHVPSKAEYQQLIDYLDEGTVGTASWDIAIPKMKATSGWYGDDIAGGTGNFSNNGNNSSGFSAYPGQMVDEFGVAPEGGDGYWFFTDQSQASGLSCLHMEAVPQWLLNGSSYTEGGFDGLRVTASCRCVKD